MNVRSFKAKLESPQMGYMLYSSQYNDFWEWKIGVEANGMGHILDDSHIDETCKKLLNILPGWQTYRGVECNYGKWLPVSLCSIANAYDQIRNCSLLDFDKIPERTLKLIWHELGRVKTDNGNRTSQGDYCIIAVCKPLMFIWGQTPPFDSINRDKMYLSPYGQRWYFEWWKAALNDLRKELLRSPAVVGYCRNKATELYRSAYVVPYGRFFDIYYY